MASTFTATMGMVCKRALRILGVVEQGGAPTEDQFSEATEAFNSLIKYLQNEEILYWTTELQTKVFTPGDLPVTSFVPDTNIMGIASAYVRYNNVDSEIAPMLRGEYMLLPDKATAVGLPRQYYLEMLMTGTTLYLYPALNDESYVVNYDMIRRINDALNTSAAIDFPSRWVEPLVFLTAETLSHEYGIPLAERQFLMNKATALKDKARMASLRASSAGASVAPVRGAL